MLNTLFFFLYLNHSNVITRCAFSLDINFRWFFQVENWSIDIRSFDDIRLSGFLVIRRTYVSVYQKMISNRLIRRRQYWSHVCKQTSPCTRRLDIHFNASGIRHWRDRKWRKTAQWDYQKRSGIIAEDLWTWDSTLPRNRIIRFLQVQRHRKSVDPLT